MLLAMHDRTREKAASSLASCNARLDKGNGETRLSRNELYILLIKRKIRHKTLQISQDVFEDAGVLGVLKPSCVISSRGSENAKAKRSTSFNWYPQVKTDKVCKEVHYVELKSRYYLRISVKRPSIDQMAGGEVGTPCKVDERPLRIRRQWCNVFGRNSC